MSSKEILIEILLPELNKYLYHQNQYENNSKLNNSNNNNNIKKFNNTDKTSNMHIQITLSRLFSHLSTALNYHSIDINDE